MGENEILEDKITNVELEQDESEYEEELDENVL